VVIKSLGRRTDLIFAKFSGSVTDLGSYTLIQTPNNPAYHWGNYIIFDRAPQRGSLKEWTELFDREFNYYSEPHHYVFTWDTDESGEYQEFLEANFEFDSATVLTTSKLSPPLYLNTQISVRKIESDKDWSDVVHLQTLYADPKFMSDYYRGFKQRQMDSFREMANAGMGSWFGAFIDDELVGDLGIFYEGKIGRYQNVGTHPDQRRQGICATLVYKTGLIAFEEFGVDSLVMEADINYHAARIYESVGFRRTEVNYALTWWKRATSQTV
jgi:hypothetical protein